MPSIHSRKKPKPVSGKTARPSKGQGPDKVVMRGPTTRPNMNTDPLSVPGHGGHGTASPFGFIGS